MLEQQLGRRQTMLLDRIMQSGFVLYVSGVDIGALADQKFAQLDALNGIDKTSSAVEVGQFEVRSGLDQEFD